MKHTNRWIALLLAVVMMLAAGITVLAEEVTGQTTEAVGGPSQNAVEIKGATATQAEESSYYKSYVSIGDSCGSGLGLPQYVAMSKERKLRWLPCEKIEGSYPVAARFCCP